MDKCLITKLTGIVNNKDLFKLGELRIFVNSTEEVSLPFGNYYGNPVTLTYDGTVTVKNANDSIIESGHVFTKQASTNLKVKGNGFISIISKYDLHNIGFPKGTDVVDNSLAYCKGLKNLDLGEDFSMSVSELVGVYPNYITIRMGCTVKDFPADFFKKASSISRTGGNTTKDNTFTGDIADLGVDGCSFNNMNATTPLCSWSARTNNKWMNITGYLPMDKDSIDRCLIDLAKATPTGSKTISLSGKRSSKSDDAVSTLTSKGVKLQIPSAS